MEGGKLRASYEEDLNRLKTAQKNAAIADLENTRNQALSNLEAERNSNTALYNQQRSTANAQNRMQAKNFQEYLASTGRANSGLPAQARMQYDNNLNNSLNYLNTSEAGALADINRRQTLANDTYNSGLAKANATIESNYIQSLLDERNKELNRQLQERELAESIRQFNENLALQREKLYTNFNSGSGGGSSDNGTDGDYVFTDGTYSNTAKNSTVSDIEKAGQKYGYFSNGYQPKGILGYGVLSKTGDTIDVNGKTQNIWKTPNGELWYWDGSVREYKLLPINQYHSSTSSKTHGGTGKKG